MSTNSFSNLRVVAFAGGVGGAKLAEGLYRVLSPQQLTVVVNTGDDFDHLGLRICTDLDTVCYTLAGLANPVTGWGLKDETWQVFTMLNQLGGPAWFHLGDKDLATHLQRTAWLDAGTPLSEVTARLCKARGIHCRVLPMSDDTISTQIQTAEGDWLDFQEYFVHQNWQPVVRGVHFQGAEAASPAPGVLEAIAAADVVVLCPSNPLVSVDPILAVPGIRQAAAKKPIVALSPIVDGKAIKGPLAKMIMELYNVLPSATWVADYYLEHFKLDGFVLDNQDRALLPSLAGRGIICKAIPSVMLTEQDRMEVASQMLALGENILRRKKLL